jgi:hypothetical protein
VVVGFETGEVLVLVRVPRMRIIRQGCVEPSGPVRGGTGATGIAGLGRRSGPGRARTLARAAGQSSRAPKSGRRQQTLQDSGKYWV